MKSGLSKEDWKAKKAYLKELKGKLTKEKKAEKKAMKQEWKGMRKGCWEKKKAFFKGWKHKAMSNKIQSQIDKTIANALPQIVQQVAQILNANQAHINTDLPEMKRVEMAKEACLPIHVGFVCDGCGTKP